MTIRLHIFVLALAFVVGIPPLAIAMPQTGRRITGIVQESKEQSREAVILQTNKGTPLRFFWNNRTTFVANMQFVDAAILMPGAKVEVIYHHPFFGKPFVTKVTLLSISDHVP